MLPDRVPSNDKGDDVQLRFGYQHSFTCLLAIQMYSKQFNFKEIFCEHHEDILAVSPDCGYTGIQIKTRGDLIPFSLNDEAIKKSIVRFTKLEEQFPDDFLGFVIISNCGFRNELAEDIGEILNDPRLDSEQIQLKRKIKRYIQKISEKYKTDKSITRKVLSKLACLAGPSLYEADSTIIEGYLGNLPECKSLNLEDLRVILGQIRELVRNASSRKIADSVNNYILFTNNSGKTAKELDIQRKRITPKQIGDIIEWNINRIRQANRRKDSSLQLVDIDIVDDNGNVFPYLDIKVRNVGHKIAVLKKAELHVYRTWLLKNPWRPRALRISCNYDLILPISRYPTIEILSLSQVVEPNDADRFTITLGNDEPPSKNQFVYQLKLLLVYDEDNKTIQSDELFVLSRRPSAILGARTHPNYMIQCKDHNKMVLSELKDLEGVKSKCLDHIINRHLQDGEVPPP